MKLWLKYAFNRTLTTFLGPADRGEETHADYLRRQYEEEKARKRAGQQQEDKVAVAAGSGARQLDYQI